MMTREEAAAILAESKRQNEVMRDNPHTFFAPEDFVKGPENAKKRIEALEMAFSALNGDGRQSELGYLLAFASENCFDSEVCCDQLRSLWTAYCLHHGLDADTAQYDNDLLTLWTEVEATESDNVFWNDFDSFDNFMCCHLV